MSGFVFFSFPPGAELAPFVDSFWGVRGSAHYHVESVLPNGAIELMVNFGPRQKVVAYGERDAQDEFRRAWIAGIQDQRVVHASPEGANHIAARFRAGGAHAFFDLPMYELTNRVVELDDLIGSGATGQLWSRLRDVADDEGRCRAFERWLLERRTAVHPSFATVRRAIDLLRGSARGTPVGVVCARLGMSNRHLIKQFRETVGLAPKSYGRIDRFQSVIGACRGKDDVSWSRLAVEYGFADQSHLIREFRRLGMITPGEFLASRTPDESHVIVE
ncbi:MAG: AraC family transcriptional regulator [Gemmatimonadota bacterium]